MIIEEQNKDLIKAKKFNHEHEEVIQKLKNDNTFIDHDNQAKKAQI